MFESRDTPHDNFAKYLLLRAKDAKEAVDFARSYNLAFLFLNDREAEAKTEEMRATMPEDLKTWHCAGRERAFTPPSVGWAWALSQGIGDFYRYHLLGETDSGSAMFRDAMSMSSRSSARRLAETLRIGGMDTTEIQSMLREVQFSVDLDTLEYYFHNFFSTEWMSEHDALQYAAKIKSADAVAGLSNYKGEADAKRYIVLHPGGYRVVVSLLGLGSNVSSAFALQSIKATAYHRMMEAYSPHTTPDRLDSLAASDEVYKNSAALLSSCVALENKVSDSITSNDRAHDLKVMLESRQSRLEITSKITEAEIIPNHKPPQQIIETNIES